MKGWSFFVAFSERTHITEDAIAPTTTTNQQTKTTMPNMSYCRFQNTKGDLRDCVENFWDIHSKDEAEARKRLVELAKEIVELAEENPEAVDNCEYEDEDFDDEEEND